MDKKFRFKPLRISIFIILLLLAVIMIAPFIWMISVSFERYANINPPFPPRFIPEIFSMFNYQLAIENGYIFKAYTNSLITVSGSVFIGVISSLLAGYAFSKGQFKGKKIIFLLVLATMMIPLETRLIPLYRIVNVFKLQNTYTAVIMPNLIYGFGVLLSKQYFDQLPNSLREAAYMDGSGEFKTFFHIYLPLSGPIIATMSILSFISNWNSFVWPFIVLSGLEKRTVPVFLSSFSTENGDMYAGITMAVATLAVIPVVIVFLFLQKYIIQSTAMSGLKGE